MLTEWREEMATGDEVIDSQHKELLRRIDDLLKGAKAARGSEEIGKLLWFLKKYVRQHFRAEEKLQLSCGFSGYQAHKAQHEAFFREVRRLESLHAEQGASTVLIVAAIRSMCDWKRNHFQRMDKALVEFVRENSGSDD